MKIAIQNATPVDAEIDAAINVWTARHGLHKPAELMCRIVDQRPRAPAVVRAKRAGESAAGAVDIDRGITLSRRGFAQRHRWDVRRSDRGVLREAGPEIRRVVDPDVRRDPQVAG